ncbi:hypothetical protein [Yimella sp. cx-51]|uniref:hypothetical protein n=1 Tax=Yimella sp. cx-51 TaxID=2770551 RepID=UPI00165E4561|nr:hypothetical protein [Yimella sp. cx-51]MBC9957194.1 hypothetical protein [Yimella sp. cx-51]QTH37157.1 hypothetical protein J5M86_09590 [Yimella sp. cx-51]
MSDQPRNVRAWSDDRDRTSEMPTAAYGHVGADRTDEFQRSTSQPSSSQGAASGADRPNSYAAAPSQGGYSQHRPGAGQPYRVGQEPVPTGPIAGPGVLRRYSAFPTAATAAIVSALVALGSSFVANLIDPPSDAWASLAWRTTNLSGTAPQYASRTTDIAIAAAVVGIVVGLLVLLATVGAKWSASRGLVLLATWGASFIGGVLAATAVLFVEASSIRAEMVNGAIAQGALWALVFGWIAGFVAALVRPGRRVN